MILIRAGYELIYEFPKPTPLILTLNIHYSRASDLARPDNLITIPSVPVTSYRDGFGNWCSRLVAPQGTLTLTADATVRDSGLPEQALPNTWQHNVQDLPEETLVFLLGPLLRDGSAQRHRVETVLEYAGRLARVQAICDSCTTTSPLATSTPARRKQPSRFSTIGVVSAATSRILRSRCAAA